AQLGNITSSGITFTLLDSTVNASAPFAPVAAASLSVFRTDTVEPQLSASDVSFAICGSTIASTGEALVLQRRSGFVGGAIRRYNVANATSAANSSFLIASSHISTPAPATSPDGACLTLPATGVRPSAVRNVTLRCGGAAGTTSGTVSTLFAARVVDASTGHDSTGRIYPRANMTAPLPFASCDAFMRDPIGVFPTIPCDRLRVGGPMAGHVLFEHCVIADSDTTILVDAVTTEHGLTLTLRNVTWTRGSLRLLNSSGGGVAHVAARIEASTFADTGDALVVRSDGPVRNVSLAVVDSRINAPRGSAASLVGSLVTIDGVRVLLAGSSVQASGAAGSVLTSAPSWAAASLVSLTAHDSSVTAVGASSVAALSVMRDSGADSGGLAAHSITIAARNATLQAVGSANLVAAAAIAARGALNASSVVTSVTESQLASRGAQYVTSAGALTYNGHMALDTASVLVTHSRVTATGSAGGVAVAGWLAWSGGLTAINVSVRADRCSLDAHSDVNWVALAAWVAWGGSLDVTSSAVTVVATNATATATNGAVASAAFLNRGAVTVANCSLELFGVNVSVRGPAGGIIVAVGSLATFGALDVTGVRVVAVDSSVHSESPRGGVLAVAAGAFIDFAQVPSATVAAYNVTVCSSTIVSSQYALTFVAGYQREGAPPHRHTMHQPISVASLVLRLENSTLITTSPAPYGDCLTVSPSG
ncbi:MAG: hypothetical protein Q8J97_14650, partial [Flavobacteriaceae bacterium]|nr:hypothetical protein [Flavobacteriaceae bacterium]